MTSLGFSAIGFSAYWPLWLLLGWPLMLWSSARSRTRLSRPRLRIATALRCAVLGVLVVALMGPVWQRGSQEISVVYVLDVSHSVASNSIQSALRWIAQANESGAPVQARYVAFAESARVVSSVEDIPHLAVSAQARAGALNQGATDLEAALHTAMSGFDPQAVKRLVLISDGKQTRGDVWRMLPRLQEQGVRVFAYPAAPRAAVDAWIEAIDVPRAPRRDEPVTIEVRVVSLSAMRARLDLMADGAVLSSRRAQLEPGSNRFAFSTRLRRAGTVTLAARVTADGDLLAENDVLKQAVWVGPRPKVLYVEGQTDSAHYLRDALRADGLQVETGGVDALGESAQSLAPYDAVIISDVPADALGAARMRAIQAYVRDLGGGLLFAAGESTYGKSGYSSSALEQVLPVEFKAQEKRKDLALVICMDRSYSMKGRNLDMAKAAARATLALLEEQHRFGVIAFDSQPREAVPLQPVRSRRRAEDLIDRIQASGQTNIYPALQLAYRVLSAVESQRKHVILLSDGDTGRADFERLLKRMGEAQITVSSVVFGAAGDRELMANIARWGRGRGYVAEDVAQIPQLFIEDTQNVSRTTLIEEPFRPVVKRKVEALRGLDFAAAPALAGFASTKARDDAEVLLATEAGAPVLVRWQYGLGRAMLFASDVKNRWAADWLQWPGYGRFWSQSVREISRKDTGEELDFQAAREGEEALLTLNLASPAGAWRNLLQPQVRVERPNGAVQIVQLRQSAPGHYQAKVALHHAAPAPLGFSLLEGPGISRQAVLRAGTRKLYFQHPDELRSALPDLALLRGLSEQTGGKLSAPAAQVFDPGADRGSRRSELWPWFAGTALLLYLCDVALRRMPWAGWRAPRRLGGEHASK